MNPITKEENASYYSEVDNLIDAYQKETADPLENWGKVDAKPVIYYRTRLASVLYQKKQS